MDLTTFVLMIAVPAITMFIITRLLGIRGGKAFMLYVSLAALTALAIDFFGCKIEPSMCNQDPLKAVGFIIYWLAMSGCCLVLHFFVETIEGAHSLKD